MGPWILMGEVAEPWIVATARGLYQHEPLPQGRGDLQSRLVFNKVEYKEKVIDLMKGIAQSTQILMLECSSKHTGRNIVARDG